MTECPICKGEYRDSNVAEAIFTLAAVRLAIANRCPPSAAARMVAEQRHEVLHALAEWKPPTDSYRAEDAE